MWLPESLGWQSWGAKGSKKDGYSPWNPKLEQAIPPHQKTCLWGEQDWPGWAKSLGWNSGRKKKRFSLGRKGKQCRRTTRIPLAYAGKKLERPKGHLELHLASAIKDSNKCFYKYISYKRRAKGNLIFNGCWGTQRQRLRKRLRYLIPSLPQTLISRPAVVWVPTHLSWKNWSFTWQ